MMTDFVVLGAGAMGTAMSYLIASNSYDVLIWARRSVISNAINKKHVNIEYMPQLVLQKNIKSTTDIQECIESSNNILR